MSRFYPYLYAGLPELSLQTEVKGFDFNRILEEITRNMEGNDVKLLRLLQMGIAPQKQTPYFYCKTTDSPSRFIREYFAYDKLLRIAQVLTSAKKLGVEPHEYLTDEQSETEIPAEIIQAMDTADLLEREQKIDALRWNKATDITVHNVLDTENVLAFVLKASLINRWMKLNKEKGAIFFKQLVQEARGTFNIKEFVDK